MLKVYNYDAEDSAEKAVQTFLAKREPTNNGGVTKRIEDQYMSWFLKDASQQKQTAQA